MKNVIRISLAVFAVSLALQTPARAQDPLCIPLVTCPTTPPAQDAPEISGTMLSSGLALVAGVATMIRARRKSSR